MLELNEWDQCAVDDPRFVFYLKLSTALEDTLTANAVRALVGEMLAIAN
jgi:hypothetical protein